MMANLNHHSPKLWISQWSNLGTPTSIIWLTVQFLTICPNMGNLPPLNLNILNVLILSMYLPDAVVNCNDVQCTNDEHQVKIKVYCVLLIDM